MLTKRNLLRELLDDVVGVWENVLDSREKYVIREDGTFSLVHSWDGGVDGRSGEGEYTLRDNRIQFRFIGGHPDSPEYVFSVFRNRLTLRTADATEGGRGRHHDYIRIG